MVYCPYAQEAEGTLNMFFTVRTDRDPYSVVSAVRREIYLLDKELPVANISSMDDIVSSSVGQARLEMLVLEAFGALALVLSGVGIYGLMSYSVTQRTREIGIRIALGARWLDVMRAVMKQGLVLTAFGLAIGVAGAVTLTRTMKSMIFGISAADPMVLAGVCGLLALTALVAIYFPARRAAKIDPQIALRSE
jgi:putative ABC transport system permease protein